MLLCFGKIKIVVSAKYPARAAKIHNLFANRNVHVPRLGSFLC